MAGETEQLDKDTPLHFIFILSITIGVFVFFGFFLFPISGWDFGWYQAWIVLGIMTVIMGIGSHIINKHNPRVLRNRIKVKKEGLTEETKKSARTDRFIFPFMFLGFLSCFAYPALERRHQSTLGSFPFPIPWWLETFGILIMTSGWSTIFVAQVQNAYASLVLDINEGQKLIDTGLYSKVRHPLYSGACLWVIGTPLALGSIVGLIGSAITIISLIIRIKFEEDMLIKGMDGYVDYQQRVKYKLFRGIY